MIEFQIAMKCPDIQAMFIQNVKLDFGRQYDDDAEDGRTDQKLHNEFLQRFFLSLQFTKKLGVLRYNSV